MWRRSAMVLAALALLGCSAQTGRAGTIPVGSATVTPPCKVGAPAAGPVPKLVPVPVSLQVTAGSYALSAQTSIIARQDAGLPAATYLAKLLRRSTGFPLPVANSGTGIVLDASGEAAFGREGYRLGVADCGVVLTANTGEGLFRGVQTLRQLLPAKVESPSAQHGPWHIAGVQITDSPRFAYRGVMLDVARHFFSVAQVEDYLDRAVAYKVNTFHLHLSDDQGWRIAINSWPRLATVGGRSSVHGDPGGYFTQSDYSAIVQYAKERFITVIPEIDGPGHTNAALASYAKLNCDGHARPPYTGTSVGFSSLCTGKAITYQFLDDVLGELAALTPGPYLNIGGDEAKTTNHPDYLAYVGKVQQLVRKHGKSLMGWEEIGGAKISSDSVTEHWNPVTGTQAGTEVARQAVAKGVKLVMAPADHAYLDMKYTVRSQLGTEWAGHVEVKQSYAWDPAKLITGVGESHVLGVEAPIWTETMKTPADLHYMAYPRLPGIAEIGWSPAASHSWPSYRLRLAAQGARWTAAGLAFYHSPQVPF
jgi:hexosaminidase